MLLRKITNQNIVEILIIPLIFVSIFGLGLMLLVLLDVENYLVYTGWCLLSGVIVIALVGAYTYLMIDESSIEKYVNLKRQIVAEAEKYRIKKVQRITTKRPPKKFDDKLEK